MGLTKDSLQFVGDDKEYASREIASEVANKGFIQTSAQDVINWARTGSLHWMTFGLACCAVEMMHTSTPRYDLERFGSHARREPHRQSYSLESNFQYNFPIQNPPIEFPNQN